MYYYLIKYKMAEFQLPKSIDSWLEDKNSILSDSQEVQGDKIEAIVSILENTFVKELNQILEDNEIKQVEMEQLQKSLWTLALWDIIWLAWELVDINENTIQEIIKRLLWNKKLKDLQVEVVKWVSMNFGELSKYYFNNPAFAKAIGVINFDALRSTNKLFLNAQENAENNIVRDTSSNYSVKYLIFQKKN